MSLIFKNKFKVIVSIFLIATLAFSTTGCGIKKTQSQKDTNITNTQDISDFKPQKTKYPLTITTYGSDGNELKTTYKKTPTKAIAVYQGSIETMLSLGLQDKLIATAGLDNPLSSDLNKVFDKKKYLTEFAPSKETVTMKNPDFILSWGSYFSDKTLGNASDWVNNGTNIYINSNTRDKKNVPGTLDNEFKDIINIGKIFDVQKKAYDIVSDMQNKIKKVKNSTSKSTKKPKASIIEFDGSPIRNYGQDTLGGNMLTTLGGKLAKKDSTSIGKEDLIKLNPDVIFVVYMAYSGDNPEKVKNDNLNKVLKDKSLSSLSAVKNKRVIPIMLGNMYASGVRTKDGIVDFANGLYPNLKEK